MADNLDQLDEVTKEAKESKKDLRAGKKEEKRLRKEQNKADKNHEEFDNQGDKSGSKVVILVVVIGLVLTWLVVFGLLIKYDVGGFGSGVLKPVLKDVPYINQILPESELKEKTVENFDYPYKTVEEAIAQIKLLELELEEAQEVGQKEADSVEELQSEMERLQTFEKSQVEFQNLKSEFYEEVVFGQNALDINEYQKYYESIDPTNAEILYKQVVEQVTLDKEVKDYATTYASMKPKQAAAILEEISDNLNLVAQILESMDTKSRADILGAMNSDFAAKITKIMAPEE